MKNSFWGLIWQSFLEIYAVPATFLGIIISVIAWILSSKTQVSLPLVITIAVFTLIVIITLFHAAYKAFRYTNKLESELEEVRETNENLVNEVNKWRIPKILRVQKNQNTDFILCLLESSDLFAIKITVSFYYTDEDGFERFIGLGFIENIQTDGKIQAVMNHPFSTYQNILDKLANNDHTVLERTIIRPGTPNDFNQP
ncbi:conserved hypothetical protein [Rippkaea orientalis PCC 8801]|uniref:Uncharacterized protein n=1 Tax=Rippkaea orientalis (strain PCC 8801 / RF-1) TaxID=41431 RepID=B7JVB2_RIPO1|nr:hypothetical protein [Rippkaea orientalis]ACK68245.1 conserved hypothetical protein [Rippkaea orientalis PCC 8801]